MFQKKKSRVRIYFGSRKYIVEDSADLADQSGGMPEDVSR